jgi:hypothetical protein
VKSKPLEQAAKEAMADLDLIVELAGFDESGVDLKDNPCERLRSFLRALAGPTAVLKLETEHVPATKKKKGK